MENDFPHIPPVGTPEWHAYWAPVLEIFNAAPVAIKIDPLGPAGRHIPDRPDNGCWLWRGAKNSTDYGRVKIRGRTLMAHRAVYEHVNGKIPSSKIFVLHSCDNPACCNPAHLSLGDARQNAREMVVRGRDQHAKRRGYTLRRPGWGGQVPKPVNKPKPQV